MTNRLIELETALLKRSFADAFSRTRDRVLLIVVVLIAAFWLRAHFVGDPVSRLPEGVFWSTLLGFPAGVAAQGLLAARLNWLSDHSPISAAALQRGARRGYLAFGHGLFVAAVAAIAGWIGLTTGRPLPAILLAVTSYAGGATLTAIRTDWSRDTGGRPVPASIIARRSAAGGTNAMFQIIVAHQTGDRSGPARGVALILGAIFAATLAATLAPGTWTAPARIAATAAPALAALLWVSRVETSLLGFLPSAGYSPAATGLAVSALPFGCIATALLAIGVARLPGSQAAAAIVTIAGAAFILVGLARTWLSPGRSARSIALQIEIELAAVALIGFALPPLAPALVAGRLVLLYRRAAALRWMLI